MPWRINLKYLKLGGSLITDKNQPHTARLDVLERLAGEIAGALEADPSMRLLLGHGSGSFGHVPAMKYGTRTGVRSAEQWQGFTEVWREAAALDQLVIDALHAARLPAIALPASAAVTADNGRVSHWDLAPITSALGFGLLPVIYGDVIFDLTRGGTILSTEDLFAHLALELKPRVMLLAGLEEGVWADFPTCTRLAKEITPETYDEIAPVLGGSTATDVTGGMASKVLESLRLVQAVEGLEVRIFSGNKPGALQAALLGEAVGTRIWQE